VRTSMLMRLIKDYPELTNQVTKDIKKPELESLVRQKGNVFKCYLVRSESDNAARYHILPVELRLQPGDDFSKIPNYKSFLSGLKLNTKAIMKDYGNTPDRLSSPEVKTLPEKDQAVISAFLSNSADFQGCEVHVEVIESAPELSEFSDDDISADPVVTPTFKSLNIVEGSRYGKSIKLPKYHRTDNSDVWVDKCTIILALSGVTNQVRQISQMVTELAEDVQDSVLTEMASQPATTIREFKKILRRCARLSDNEITRTLTALKYDEKTHKNFRAFFYKVKSLIQSQLPEGTESSLIEKITLREFMTKVPEVVAQNTYFRNFPTTDANALIDLADNIYSDAKKPRSSTELNYFPPPKTGSKSKGSKDKFCAICKKKNHSTDICFLNPKNPDNRLKDGKGNSQNKGKDNRGSRKEITCYRCGLKGHISSKCRAILND